MQLMTDEEVARTRKNQEQSRASMACEGIYLTDEEEALFESFNAQHLPHEERRRRVIEYSRAKCAEEALTLAAE